MSVAARVNVIAAKTHRGNEWELLPVERFSHIRVIPEDSTVIILVGASTLAQLPSVPKPPHSCDLFGSVGTVFI